jgi:hypothetical protein
MVYSDYVLTKCCFEKRFGFDRFISQTKSFCLNIDYIGYICLGLYAHINRLNMRNIKINNTYRQIICPSFNDNMIKTFYLK